MPAADGSGSLKDIDGFDLGGTIDVANVVGPYPQSKPTISDTTPVVGQELTADPGPQGPTATFHYLWHRGTTLVSSGQKTYTVQPGDYGKKLTVRVTVEDDVFWDGSEKTSSATSAVGKGSFGTGSVAVSTDTPTVGVPMTATVTGWVPAPATQTYQWYRVSSKGKLTTISGATLASYTPRFSDLNSRLKVTVTAHGSGYKNASATRVSTSAVANP